VIVGRFGRTRSAAPHACREGGEQAAVQRARDAAPAAFARRWAASAEIDGERGRAALADLADLPLHRYPHDRLLPCVRELRNNLRACDAVNVTLAGALDAPLLTRDQRLAGAARPSGGGSSWCGARVDLAGRERTLSTQ